MWCLACLHFPCLLFSISFTQCVQLPWDQHTPNEYSSAYMLDVLHWLPLQQRNLIPYWCPGLEVYPGSCSGLPPRSLPSHPGHQRSLFTPLIGTGVTLGSFARTSTAQA